ncbi:hypothetical protein [Tateyamaria pelophila]|uniref:hypothetical protein n=1 Tax=Tateyamaria pelophila TaxID=328415 RepID=UPI001CBE6143|nr:hypothetical protein [Tateyamaria pelophila]
MTEICPDIAVAPRVHPVCTTCTPAAHAEGAIGATGSTPGFASWTSRARFSDRRRRDGRLTETTDAGTLNFEGLRRLRACRQPSREQTRNLMQVEMK